MSEIEHYRQPPALPAPVEQSRFQLAPRGFARTTLAPIAAIAAIVGITAVARQHWGHLLAVAIVAPVTVLVQWALTTHAAACRGVAIHPAARALALVVLGAGIVACLFVCALAVVAPETLGLTPVGGTR